MQTRGPVVTAYVDAKTRKNLRRAAFEEDRSISAIVNEALKLWLSQRTDSKRGKR
jgi:hypothetical protein